MLVLLSPHRAGSVPIVLVLAVHNKEISKNAEGGANMDINEIHEVETVEVASDLVMASFTSFNC